MNDNRPEGIGPHDLGGLTGDPLDRSEHDVTHWERRVDAMLNLLMRKEVMTDPAQLRRGIESLATDVYERLSYYERWAGSIAINLVEQGMVTQEELDQRIAAVKARGEPA